MGETDDEGISKLTIQANEWRPEIVSLARELERLPPGSYIVRLEKPDIRGVPWQAEIVKYERMRILELWR